MTAVHGWIIAPTFTSSVKSRKNQDLQVSYGVCSFFGFSPNSFPACASLLLNL